MGIENREVPKMGIEVEKELRGRFTMLVEETREKNGFCEIENASAVAGSLTMDDLEILRKFFLSKDDPKRLTTREFQEYRKKQFGEDESQSGTPNEARRFFASFMANRLMARGAKEEMEKIKSHRS